MKRVVFAALLLWAAAFVRPLLAAEKVLISYSSRTYAFLPAEVASAKGFFRDEGLEPVLVQMRSQVAVPAMMNGDIQYTLTFRSERLPAGGSRVGEGILPRRRPGARARANAQPGRRAGDDERRHSIHAHV